MTGPRLRPRQGYSILYPKYKSGGHIDRKLTQKATYGKWPIFILATVYVKLIIIYMQAMYIVDDLFAKLWTLIEGSKADSMKLAVSPPPL